MHIYKSKHGASFSYSVARAFESMGITKCQFSNPMYPSLISSIFRSICIDSIPNIRMISIHVCLGIVMARIYVSLTLSCPSRAFSWRGGAEYSVVVWIIFSTTPMLVAGRLLIVQYKIKAKMILQPSLGTVLIKSEIEATDPS